jgi:hypothetical protein
MKSFALKFGSIALFVSALLPACSGGALSPRTGGAVQQAVRSAPAPFATGIEPPIRPDIALASPVRSRVSPGKHTVLVNETFANIATGANDWTYYTPACLTAGASPPPGSLPPCGSLAPQDPPGGGALQLTPDTPNMTGLVGWYQPLKVGKGLEVSFTLYDFNPSQLEGSDGTLLYFADGSKPAPTEPDGTGGCLGYFYKSGWCPGPGGAGLANAYLGVGFDEFGNFSALIKDGPDEVVPNTVALGGSVSTGYAYVGGVTAENGAPASLPFKLGVQANSRPSNAPTVDVTLTKAGLVEVAIDIHDGHGSKTYLSKKIIGVQGQPAVPKTLYVGIMGSCGDGADTHQINDLTISRI